MLTTIGVVHHNGRTHFIHASIDPTGVLPEVLHVQVGADEATSLAGSQLGKKTCAVRYGAGLWGAVETRCAMRS